MLSVCRLHIFLLLKEAVEDVEETWMEKVLFRGIKPEKCRMALFPLISFVKFSAEHE